MTEELYVIDMDALDGGSTGYYSSRDARRKTLEFKTDIEKDEYAFAQNVARFLSVEYNGQSVHEQSVPFSPLGMTALEKLSCNREALKWKVSAIGAKEATLDNLSVICNGVKPILGSGSRLATEWWVKEDGYEVITIETGGVIVCVYFDKTWCMSTCNQMLYEGGELCGSTLYIREDLPRPFVCSGCVWSVVPVRKFNFSTAIPRNVEGIMMMIDFQMWRLKEEHTIDLEYHDRTLRNREGDVLCTFEDKYVNGQIIEVTMDYQFRKCRPDKQYADSRYKIKSMTSRPLLKTLRTALHHLGEEYDPYYLPTQWVGYNYLRHEEGDVAAVARNKYWQILTVEQVPLVSASASLPRLSPTRDSHSVTEEVSLGACINYERMKLDFPKLIRKLKRAGYSFNVWDLRKFLIESGVRPRYDHFEVSLYFTDVTIPNTSVMFVPGRCEVLDGSYISCDTCTPGSIAIGYYDTTYSLQLKDRLYEECRDRKSPIIETVDELVTNIAFIPKGTIYVMLKVAVLNALVDHSYNFSTLHSQLYTVRVPLEKHTLKYVLEQLIREGYVEFKDSCYTLIYPFPADWDPDWSIANDYAIDDDDKILYVAGPEPFVYDAVAMANHGAAKGG